MVPIGRPGKIVCVGLNYRDHAEEQGVELPQAPLFFAKYTTALIGPGDPIVIPPVVQKCDYEAELGVVIGRTVKGISRESAFEAVAGYVVANDVSARDLQFADGQWTRGKSPGHVLPGRPARAGGRGARPTRPADPRDPERRGDAGLDDREPDLRNRRDHQLRVADLDPRGRRPDPHRHPGRCRCVPRSAATAHPGDSITIEIDGVGSITNPVVAG